MAAAAILLFLVSLLMAPRVAAAQFCIDCPNQAPTVQIVAPTVVTSATLNFSIHASDDGLLDTYTWQLWDNGVEVTSWVQSMTPPLAYGPSLTAAATVTLTAGVHWLKTRICDTWWSGASCTVDSLQVTYNAPPPPDSVASPVLTLAQRNDARFLDGCATCASATAAYATPAFVVGGSAQGAGVRYSSELAHATGYVEVDANINSVRRPYAIGIRLRKSNGSLIQLSNGATEAFVDSAVGTVRLAAQFDASSEPTGLMEVSVEVSAYYGPPTTTAQTRSDTLTGVRIFIHNAKDSPYGRGWTVPGDERIHLQSTGDLVVTDGAGNLSFYQLYSCGGSPWVCTYTSPAGALATMRREERTPHLGGAPDTLWVRDNGDGTTAEWGSNGLLKFHGDYWGNRLTFSRMGSGDVTRVYRISVETEAGSGAGGFGGTAITKHMTFAYDGNGKLSSITLPDGRVSTFSVGSGSGGLLSTATDPDGVTALAATYLDGRLVSIAGRNTARDTLVYDAFGQLKMRGGPAVATSAGTTRDTVAVGSLRAKLLTGNGTSSTGSKSSAVLADSAYQLLTDRAGTTTRVWSAPGGTPARVKSKTSTGKVDSVFVTYNASHQPVTDGGTGRAGTEYTWSGAKMTAATDLGSGLVTEYFHRAHGQVDSVRVNGTRQLRNFFSGYALAPDSSVADGSNVVRYTYDSRGRALTVRDVNNITITNTYETTHGNLASVSRSASGATTITGNFTYDASGRQLTSTDPLGRVYTTSYDTLSRVKQRVGPLSTSTTRTYNDVAGTYSLTDAKGQVYTTYVNAAGWVTQQQDPRGNRDSVRYDANGRVETSWSRRGDVVKYTYDGLGRVLTRTDSVPGQAANVTTFAYDSLKTWASVANAESVDTMFYDAAGRLRETKTVRSGYAHHVRYTYTGSTLASMLRVSRDTGSVAVWADTMGVDYDTWRRAYRFKDFGGAVTVAAMDVSGRPSVDTLPTSATASSRIRKTYGYSPASDMLSETFSGAPNYLLSREYGDYDALGRIGSITRQGSPVPVVRLHEYDALGRLKKFRDQQTTREVEYFQVPNDPYGDCPGCFNIDSTVTDVVTVLDSAVYAYDSVSNRRDSGDSLQTGNRLIKRAGWTITYDSAGFITKRTKGSDTLSYTWNGLGQLTEVRSAAASTVTTTTYGYDGLGRRVRKTVGGVSTRYLLDGDRVLVELDHSWSPVAKYSYYPGADRPHAMLRDNKRYYYAQDMQGNVTGLIDSVGNVTQHYNYRPYGEVPADGGQTVANPYRYKAREWDAEAQLYFMRARYYDPVLGRFISEDPIGLAGGVNPTAFVDGEPVGRVDPSGLDWHCIENRSFVSVGPTSGSSGTGGSWATSSEEYYRCSWVSSRGVWGSPPRGSIPWPVGEGAVVVGELSGLEKRNIWEHRTALRQQCSADAGHFGLSLLKDVTFVKLFENLRLAYGASGVLARGVRTAAFASGVSTGVSLVNSDVRQVFEGPFAPSPAYDPSNGTTYDSWRAATTIFVVKALPAYGSAYEGWEAVFACAAAIRSGR